jgi:predicted hotdog family 3-hydroxylacyl-ACP dehydratase
VDGALPITGNETLADLLPQADPMILLSGYRPPTEPGAVEAWVDISPASPFFDAAADGVPGCVALEYMAQTMALCVGFDRRRRGLPPKLGFVLGSRKLEITLPFFTSGARYGVRAACTYQDESFGSFDCSVFLPAGDIVAAAQMTAFQPSDDATPESLEAFS